MDLLGDDGVGYELAKKLESNGGWRAWLGDSHYMQMAPYFNSFSAWKNFMSNVDKEGNKSNAQIHLQLRVRALLFDKAAASLYLRSSSSASLASLHPSYLQLHADDIYYSLEEDVDDWHRLEAKAPSTTKALQTKDIERNSSARSRFIANEVEGASSRSKNGDILDTWYSQWREKHLKDRMQRFSWRLGQRELPFGDRDTYRRTPEGMSAYLMFSEKHRKKRRVTKLDRELHSANSGRENVSGIQAECIVETGCSVDEEICFFPETMFPSNCVPDSSVPGRDKEDENPTVEVPGIFENLPFETTRSPLLIERFGMGSEYLSLGSRKVDNTGKGMAASKRKRFSEEEATHRARQTVVRIVGAAGFEGLREGSMDVLSQLLSCHICKLGRTLRLLADSFRNHYAQIELLRMFLHTIGYSNLGTLMDYIKSEKRLSSQQTQQQFGRVTQTQRPIIAPHVQQVTEPLVRVLRMVDGEGMPMGFIYEAMDRAKEAISHYYRGNARKCEIFWRIIDRRWTNQLHQPIHAFAYFLNPKFYFSDSFRADEEVMAGVITCIDKMTPDPELRDKVLDELEIYKSAEGRLFSSQLAIDRRGKQQPDLWWENYGAGTPNLQKIAIRVLSQPCSASGCERNWSVFESIHTKKRNRLSQKRLNDLVFVRYNLRLRVRQVEGVSHEAIDLDEIDPYGDWTMNEQNDGDDVLLTEEEIAEIERGAAQDAEGARLDEDEDEDEDDDEDYDFEEESSHHLDTTTPTATTSSSRPEKLSYIRKNTKRKM